VVQPPKVRPAGA